MVCWFYLFSLPGFLSDVFHVFRSIVNKTSIESNIHFFHLSLSTLRTADVAGSMALRVVPKGIHRHNACVTRAFCSRAMSRDLYSTRFFKHTERDMDAFLDAIKSQRGLQNTATLMSAYTCAYVDKLHCSIKI